MPDYFLDTDNGPVIVDVKPKSRLQNEAVVDVLNWTRSVVEAKGWRYSVVTEPPLARLSNVRFLAGYRNPACVSEHLIDQACSAVQSSSTHRPHHGAQDHEGTMAGSTTRVGIGTCFVHDGEVFEVAELITVEGALELVAKGKRGNRYRLIAVAELLAGEHDKIVPDGDGIASDDHVDLASVLLVECSAEQRSEISERAGHVREVLTGYRSETPEVASADEPRSEFRSDRSLLDRYTAKANELGVGRRSVQRRANNFTKHGEAGLVDRRHISEAKPLPSVDRR